MNTAKQKKPIRKPIGKKLRFEVFKRDFFTCQYCGAHPPSVVLHVDHIVAVASGGGNDIDNLLTSCSCCNLGKGATSLESKHDSLKEKSRLLIEAEEQLVGYQEIVRAINDRLLKEAHEVADVYAHWFERWELSERAVLDIKQFVKKLGFVETMQAMEIACSRKISSAAFKYFCGICWSKIRESRSRIDEAGL